MCCATLILRLDALERRGVSGDASAHHFASSVARAHEDLDRILRSTIASAPTRRMLLRQATDAELDRTKQ